MKRLITLLLALCMVFALAACGGGSKETKCEMCGEVKTCTEVTLEAGGESATGWLCSDCEEVANGLVDLAEELGG